MVNIVTYNVNGLRNFQKRKKVYHFLKEMRYADIIFLQETHCMIQDEPLWRSQWGGHVVNSFGESNARGVALLINKKTNCKIVRYKTDINGRFVIVELKIEDQVLVLAGVYAPNVDQPSFFQSVLREMEEFQNPNAILVGDFNLIFDTELDRAGTSEYNHPKSMELLTNYMEQSEMCDIWRIRNPTARKYTCHKRNSSSFSRIDMILISNSLAQNVNKIEIKPSFNSDHSLITMNCNFSQNARGRSFWKFNSSLLHDKEHNELIKSTIEATLHKYQDENPALQWEMIKMSAAAESLRFSKAKAAERNKNLRELNQSMEWWTSLLEIYPDGQQLEIEEKINSLKNRYNQIMNEKFKSSIFRSKCRWAEQGERSSKYYFNLEKNRYNQRNVKQLINNQGFVEENPRKILDLQAAYFKKLYNKDEEVFFNLENVKGNRIPQKLADDLDVEISIEELTAAMGGLNTDKTPGADGLPSEFYKHFWEMLVNPLLKAFRFAKASGLLHISARRGIISLIPKRKKILDT